MTEPRKPSPLRLRHEVVRLLPLLLLAGVLLGVDPGGLPVAGYMIGLLLLMAAASHLVRRVLFPYMDLKLFIEKALEDSRASGMVFLGISFIIGVMIMAASNLLK